MLLGKTVKLIKALSTLIRFQAKMELFCSVFKKICVHTTTPYPLDSTHAHFNISAREIEATWQRLSTIREFKKTTTATGTSLNKRFNEQNNSCARAL